MAADSTGNVGLVGYGGSDIPDTKLAFATGGANFFAVLDPTFSKLLYCAHPLTSGSITGLDIDGNGLYYLTGDDQVDGDATPGANQEHLTGLDNAILMAVSAIPPTGVTGIHSDRGSVPVIVGGIGKSTKVGVTFNERPGVVVTLDSADPTLLQVNGGRADSVTTVPGLGAATFTVSAIRDVATATPVVLVAFDGTTAKYLTVTVKPFIRLLVARPAAPISGGPFSALLYFQEQPATDQIVDFFSTPGGAVTSSQIVVPGIAGGVVKSPMTVPLSSPFTPKDQVVNVTAFFPGGDSSTTTAITLSGPQVSTINFAPNVVQIGMPSTVTATLKQPLAADCTLLLSSNNSAASPDISVMFPAGSTVGTATVTTNQVPRRSPLTVRYSEQVNSPRVTGGLTVVPVSVTAVSVDRTTIAEGDSFNVTVSVNGGGMPPLADQIVLITGSNPQLLTAQTVVVPAGQYQVTVPFTTNFIQLQGMRQVRLVATIPGVSTVSTSLNIYPLVTSITIGSMRITPGIPDFGMIQLIEDPARPDDISVITDNPYAVAFLVPAVIPTVRQFGVFLLPFSAAPVTNVTVAAFGYKPTRFQLVTY